MNKVYETATLPEKAIGKARQIVAKAFMKSPLALPENFRAVTFCFDDFPVTAGEAGAKILEDSGARGTYLTCFGLLGTENQGGRLAGDDMIISLAQRGHEIGCHTYDHINCSFVPASEVADSCQKNMEAAREYGLQLRSFSYPQSGVTLTTKKIMQKNYKAARSGFQGINRNGADAHCLMSMPLYEELMPKARSMLGTVAREGGWLILYTHDVSDSPSEHGISKKNFSDMVSLCRENELPVMTMSDVLQRVAA